MKKRRKPRVAPTGVSGVNQTPRKTVRGNTPGCPFCDVALGKMPINGCVCEDKSNTDIQYLRSTRISISLEEYYALGGIYYGK